MSTIMSDNKEKEIALNDFGGLAVPKKDDIKITNERSDVETIIKLEIHDRHVDIIIGKLIVYDISFQIREHRELAPTPRGINTHFWDNEYYGFSTNLESTIWHLYYVPSGYRVPILGINATFPLVKLTEDQYLIRINNYPFVDSLKEKFQIKTPLLLPSVRFCSWGKYKANSMEEKYTLSIKFYDSLMEQRNDGE